MAYRKFLLFVVVLSAVSGCMRTDDDYIVPAGHPADPAARPGLVMSDSGALDPELRTVSPQVTPPAGSSPSPAPQHGQHQHH